MPARVCSRCGAAVPPWPLCTPLTRCACAVDPKYATWTNHSSAVAGRMGHVPFPDRSHEGFTTHGGVADGAVVASLSRYGFDGAWCREGEVASALCA